VRSTSTDSLIFVSWSISDIALFPFNYFLLQFEWGLIP